LYSRNLDFFISAHTNEPNDLLIFIKEVDLSGLHIDTEMLINCSDLVLLLSLLLILHVPLWLLLPLFAA